MTVLKKLCVCHCMHVNHGVYKGIRRNFSKVQLGKTDRFGGRGVLFWKIDCHFQTLLQPSPMFNIKFVVLREGGMA